MKYVLFALLLLISENILRENIVSLPTAKAGEGSHITNENILFDNSPKVASLLVLPIEICSI